jgi:hypothetical protein
MLRECADFLKCAARARLMARRKAARATALGASPALNLPTLYRP